VIYRRQVSEVGVAIKLGAYLRDKGRCAAIAREKRADPQAASRTTDEEIRNIRCYRTPLGIAEGIIASGYHRRPCGRIVRDVYEELDVRIRGESLHRGPQAVPLHFRFRRLDRLAPTERL
jgi:hypothetical protein